jgi:hypothetical protein
VGFLELNLLCQGFTLSLEKIMALLSALQLALHLPQHLARREDGLASLYSSISSMCYLDSSGTAVENIPLHLT